MLCHTALDRIFFSNTFSGFVSEMYFLTTSLQGKHVRGREWALSLPRGYVRTLPLGSPCRTTGSGLAAHQALGLEAGTSSRHSVCILLYFLNSLGL